MSKDYYKILGVASDASRADIKKAFRKLAHEHHPDKKGGNEQKFKEINEAYQVLSDSKKRDQYDRFGAGFAGAGAGAGGDQSGWGNFGYGYAGGNRANFEFDISDLFKDFFQEAFSRRDQVVTVPIPFSKAALGGEIEISTLKGPIRVKIPAGIQSGETLRVPGKSSFGSGDLLVQVMIKVPAKLNRKQKKALEELALKNLDL